MKLKITLVGLTIGLLVSFFYGCNPVNSQDFNWVKICNEFSQEELDYFAEIAFGSELNRNDKLDKWETRSITYGIMEPLSQFDSVNFYKTVSELNQLIQSIEISIDHENPDIEFWMVDFWKADSMLGKLTVPTSGRATTYYRFGQPFKGRVIVLSGKHRSLNHRTAVVREELTQVLGLGVDSYKYPESTFYQGATDNPDYTPMDRRMIQLLYNYGLKVGLTKQAFLNGIASCRE